MPPVAEACQRRRWGGGRPELYWESTEKGVNKHGKKEKRDDGNINICWPITRLVHSE